MNRSVILIASLALVASQVSAQSMRPRVIEADYAMPDSPAEAKGPTSSCTVCGPSFRAGKDLSIQGSTTLRPIIDRVNQTVKVQSGIDVTGRNLGSTTGIRALIEGECERRGNWAPMGPCDLGNDGVVGTGNGPADIGVSSRAATSSEINTANLNGVCLVEHPVAIDGLGIIVNNDPACASGFPLLGTKGLADYLIANLPGPPLGGLSETQMKEILFGNDSATLAGATSLFQQWCDLVGCANGALPNITIVSRQEEGGTYGAFLDLYVCNSLDSTASPTVCTSVAMFPFNTGSRVDPFEWIRRPSSCNPTSCGANDPVVVSPLAGTSPTQFVGSNDEVVDLVANTCGAVGYAGISFIETAIANGAKVRSFPVTQTLAQPPVAATFATTLDNTFDFTRKLYAYTAGTPYGSDPRAIYLDTLYARIGQANVFESGFVPANGVRPRNAGQGTVNQAQVVLEPIGRDLIKSSEDRIVTKLGIVFVSETVLADPLATPAEKANATTDLIESEFSVRENVEQDNLLVSRLMDRVEACVTAATCSDPVRADSELTKATSHYAVAQSALVADNPMTALDEFIQTSDFANWTRALNKAFDAARKADQACNP